MKRISLILFFFLLSACAIFPDDSVSSLELLANNYDLKGKHKKAFKTCSKKIMESSAFCQYLLADYYNLELYVKYDNSNSKMKCISILAT